MDPPYRLEYPYENSELNSYTTPEFWIDTYPPRDSYLTSLLLLLLIYE